MTDWILRGGTVIDGTGSPRFRGDVAIAGDRIAAVGAGRTRFPAAAGAREIDVSGKIVAPGFIDVHTHDDRALFAAPDMAAKASQGVTTVITGNCGISLAPLTLPPLDRSFAAAAARPDRRAGRLPLSAVRRLSRGARPVAGRDQRRLSRRAFDIAGRRDAPSWTGRRATTRSPRWRERLREALDAGAIGMSTGLFYAPAFHAPPAEIEALAALLRPARRDLYTTHMRDETEHVHDSLDESFHVGEAARVPVVISHHKVSGVGNFGRTAETLPKIAAAMRRQEIGLDAYPYVASSTVLRTTADRRRAEGHDHLVEAVSRTGRARPRRHRARLGRRHDRGGGAVAAGRRDLLDDGRRRRAPRAGLRPDDDRLGRAAARHPPAPAAVGDLPARARTLLPRSRAVRPGNRRAQDDRAVGGAVRPHRARRCAARAPMPICACSTPRP